MFLLEVLFQSLFEVLGELAFQVLLQIFLEIVSHAFIEPLKRAEEKFPSAPAVPYFFVGLVSGLLSLLFIPGSLLKNPLYKWLNLVLTPVIAGFIMAGMGKLRKGKGQDTLKMDQFFSGFVMALSFAVVRFVLAS